jgi:aryl-alcohol dehydrogenase-like predicted oxidoreductase
MLEAVKKSRRACLTGASTYGAGDARLALVQSWCDVVQVEHSVLNPSVVRALAGVKRPGQEIAARSVLCKGLLTARRRHATDLDGALAARLDRLEAQALDWGFSLPELAIRFALDTPGVDIVLVGVSNLTELDVALAATQRPPLEPWQREALAEFDRGQDDWVHPERWPEAAG